MTLTGFGGTPDRRGMGETLTDARHGSRGTGRAPRRLARWAGRSPGREVVLLVVVVTLLGAGAVVALLGSGIGSGIGSGPGAPPADLFWGAATLAGLVPAAVWVAQDLRAGRWGADLLALLALVGTLAVGEELAGAVVAAMVATGRLLEARARGRAGRDLSALLERAPARAHRRPAGTRDVETVEVGRVVPGDLVVVLPGEVVPVDGTLEVDAVLDESALTGEAAPVDRAAGEPVRSGVVNTGATVDLRASASAAESTYAGVVTLAEEASAASAPVARLADRVAAWFLPTALALAGVAWLTSGEAARAVAVLVTATPCPLLLAVPVAVTGGMSAASRAGVVVKDGAALESLGRVSTLAMDKTGTVTRGRPEVVDVAVPPDGDPRDALADAAAVERYSPHVLAGAVLRAAQREGAPDRVAEGVFEEPGSGARGLVAGRVVEVGRLPAGTSAPGWAAAAARRGRLDLATVIWVRVAGRPVAALLVRDLVRSDAARTLRRLRAVGVAHVVLLTGDRVGNAAEVGALLGVDEVRAEATPADKIACVTAARANGTTAMVGDGVNDAPALAAADVGIALGSRGSTAAARAADAVILDDRIDRLADVVEVARRTRRVAVQSAAIGTGLSVLAMLAATAGLLAPVGGALVQEGIDVAALAWAVRAVLPGRRRARAGVPEALLDRFAREHETLLPVRSSVRRAADALADGITPAAETRVRKVHARLTGELLPHEEAEETLLYPELARMLGGEEATVTMSRGHVEIGRLVGRLGRHLAEPGPLRPDQLDDLRATLYGLDAVLALHFAQEEEAWFSLASRAGPPDAPAGGASGTTPVPPPPNRGRNGVLP